jgi:ligand-binding SRPBCC domain-containing protein
MPVFEKRTRIAASPEQVFAFHERDDALKRLTPPWEKTRIVEKTPGLDVGTRAVVEVFVGPIKTTFVAEHTRYEKNRMFQDRQVRGPFASWLHTHSMEPDGNGGCLLVDRIEYELPLGAVGRLFGGPLVRRKLERMFEYRHEVTKKACEAVGSME